MKLLKKNITRKKKLKKNKSSRKGGDFNRRNNKYESEYIPEPILDTHDSSDDEEDQNNLDEVEELTEFFVNTIRDIFRFENNNSTLRYNVDGINRININLFRALLEYYYDTYYAILTDRNEMNGIMADIYITRINTTINTPLPRGIQLQHQELLIQLISAFNGLLNSPNNGGKLKRKKKDGRKRGKTKKKSKRSRK